MKWPRSANPLLLLLLLLLQCYCYDVITVIYSYSAFIELLTALTGVEYSSWLDSDKPSEVVLFQILPRRDSHYLLTSCQLLIFKMTCRITIKPTFIFVTGGVSRPQGEGGFRHWSGEERHLWSQVGVVQRLWSLEHDQLGRARALWGPQPLQVVGVHWHNC